MVDQLTIVLQPVCQGTSPRCHQTNLNLCPGLSWKIQGCKSQGLQSSPVYSSHTVSPVSAPAHVQSSFRSTSPICGKKYPIHPKRPDGWNRTPLVWGGKLQHRPGHALRPPGCGSRVAEVARSLPLKRSQVGSAGSVGG